MFKRKKFLPKDADKIDERWKFQLTHHQGRVALRWHRMHMNLQCPHGKPDAYRGAIGGGATYHFTPTSIGTIVTLYCSCEAHFYLGLEGGGEF